MVHTDLDVLPPIPRIVVLGDTHGDLLVVISAFIRAKLIIIKDGCPIWVAKNTALVQVGDQIDSCRPTDGHDCHNEHLFDISPEKEAEDFYILKFFHFMDQQARQHGSYVISLLGNHELLNIKADFRYVSKANMEHGKWPGTTKSGSDEEYRKALFKRGGPVAIWLAEHTKTVVVIGSNIFLHAGILPIFIKELDHLPSTKDKIKYLNKLIRLWLLDKIDRNKNHILAKMIPGEYNIEEIKEVMKISPFWQRIHGAIPKNKPMSNKNCAKYLKPVLETLKLDMMVIGHTPQISNGSEDVNATCYNGDKPGLVRADGGFSRAFRYLLNKETNLQFIEIIDDRKVKIKTYSKIQDYDLLDSVKKWIKLKN